jgi:hypothetical protein
MNMGGGWNLLGHNSNPYHRAEAVYALLSVYCVVLKMARTETCLLPALLCGRAAPRRYLMVAATTMPNGHLSRNVKGMR